MIQFKHTITDPNGLHARNALLLSREISGYTSVVEVQCDANGQRKAGNGLMGLGAGAERKFSFL